MRHTRLEDMFRAAPRRGTPAIAPLVDVVFLLIIFFILVSQIARERVLPIDLPDAALAGASVVIEDNTATVTVLPGSGDADTAPAVRFANESFSTAASERGTLIEALEHARRERPGLRFILRAGAQEPYENVRAALGVLREAGITDVDVAYTDTEGDEREGQG